MLTAILRALEVDVEVKDTALKRASKAPLVAVFPLFVDDLKSDILVWWSSRDFQQTGFCIWGPIRFNSVRRSLRTIDEIGIEDVKLVALYNLWRRI